jgi:hypothetical protein
MLQLCHLRSHGEPCPGRVRHIRLSLRTRDFIFEADGRLDSDDLAMDHLPSLKVVRCQVTWDDEDGEMITKLTEVVKHAVEVHPNHPKLDSSI